VAVGEGTAIALAWPSPSVGRTAAGLRVAVLERPGPVVALRLTVGVGARDGDVAGVAHMLEHLIFRTPEGAAARRQIEELGGEAGATTTREQISLDAIVVPADVPAAAAALARLAAGRPTATDVQRERTVVQRELAHEDEERRRIWQLQAEALFGRDHPLARPILGTAESLATMAHADLETVQRRVRAGNAALAAVGPVSLETMLDLADPVLAERPGDVPAPRLDPPRPEGRRHEERRSRLLHLAVGWRFGGLDDPRLPVLRLAEIILAHGSGSRLYARLRTQRRIAYRVSTVLVPYREAGHLSAVTACDPHHARQAELAIVGEVERLATQGPSWPELQAAKRQLWGSLARAFEVSRRLAGFTATQLLFDRLEPLTAMLDRLQEIEPDAVSSALESLVRDQHGYTLVSVGHAA
jgi:predicted Zn-dependent peptidase